MIERIRNLGLLQPTLELDLDNPTGDTARLYGDRRRRELLIETRLKIDRRTLPGSAMLRIEWLLLQNPRGQFTPDHPRLPGQTHPGLGMLQDLIALFILACDRLQLDGLLFVPSHYHIALQGRKTMRFLNPADEGVYRALEPALQGLSLSAAAEAVAAGRVIDSISGTPFAWEPVPMTYPVSERLREQVNGYDYERQDSPQALRLACV